MIRFPRPRLVALQELASRVLDARKPGTASETLARELLAGLHDVCMRWGLDRVLVDLGVDLADRFSLAEHATHLPIVLEALGRLDLDAGGPRNAKPRALADCLIGALELEMTDEPDRTVTLGDEVRTEVAAAINRLVAAEMAVPGIRDAIIAAGRQRCEEQYQGAFTKLAGQLDDSGMRLLRQPKLPLDAVRAVQQALIDARAAVIARIGSAALDRAKEVIANVDAEAAARIDQPITLRLTPRDVAIRRANHAPKVPAAIAASFVESLGELAGLAWRAVEKPVRPYAASQEFAVGDLIEHPKFGRGTVATVAVQRIEVEFPDGPHTLVHARK